MKAGDVTREVLAGRQAGTMLKGVCSETQHSCIRTRVFPEQANTGVNKTLRKQRFPLHGPKKTEAHHCIRGESAGLLFFSTTGTGPQVRSEGCNSIQREDSS